MARLITLWVSPEISLHQVDRPPERADQLYEGVAEDYVASFVEEGSFDLRVGEHRWRLGPGDVMLRRPGVRFQAGFDGEQFNDTCLRLTYLSGERDKFGAAQSWPQNSAFVMPASNRLRYLSWGLRRAVTSSDNMFMEYCAAEVFRAPPPTSTRPLFSEQQFLWYAERMHHVRERLEVGYAEPHSVGALARSVGMSMFHFTRVFTELIGAPPHRYLLTTRLNAALAMLREGRGVTETCFASGFNNLSHFSRTFARRFGVTPSLANQ